MATLVKNQKKTFGPKVYRDEYGNRMRIKATVRHDDECSNGHNTFSITADISEDRNGVWRWFSGGCCHAEVAAHFPELAPLLKWHLCTTDGPMHYVQNTVYHASERDCWGLLKGEPSKNPAHQCKTITFGTSPIVHRLPNRLARWIESNPTDFDLQSVHHPREKETFKPKYAPADWGDNVKWHECPWDTWDEAAQWIRALTEVEHEIHTTTTKFGEGKPRDLDAARRCAIWPDATDEELTAPGLEDRLKARLPSLLAEFRAAVESLGLEY